MRNQVDTNKLIQIKGVRCILKRITNQTIRLSLYTLFVATVVFGLTGCFLFEEEPLETVEVPDQRSVITPTIQVEENYYRSMIPFEASSTRGKLYSNMKNHRLDADRLELGLLEIAQEHFSPDNYLFREGQLITSREIDNWLRVESEDFPLGLNPADAEGRVLMHIVEHNYTNLKGDSVEGIVLGLSLAPEYQQTIVTDDDGEQKQTMAYTKEQLRNHGHRIADQLAERMRQKEPEAPIIIALYHMAERDSLVPGDFLSVGTVKAEQNYVSEWQTINEQYILFPSTLLRDNYRDISAEYNRFLSRARDAFPNYYMGIIGVGRFVDDQLIELSLTVTTEGASKTEVVQLTQFLGGEAIELFDEHVHINIYMQSINEPQAVFVRPAGADPMMHVYR